MVSSYQSRKRLFVVKVHPTSRPPASCGFHERTSTVFDKVSKNLRDGNQQGVVSTMPGMGTIGISIITHLILFRGFLVISIV